MAFKSTNNNNNSKQEYNKNRVKKNFLTEFLLSKRGKMFVLLFLYFCGISYLIFTIYMLKANFGPKFQAKAVQQLLAGSQSQEVLNPIRGSIVDRNSEDLAVSEGVYDVFIDVRLLINADNNLSQSDLTNPEKSSKEKTILELTKLFPDLTRDKLNSYLQILKTDVNKKGKIIKTYPLADYDTNTLVVEKGISYDKYQKLEKANLKYVHVNAKSKRDYIHDNLAGNLIGFIRGDTKFGLEKEYDKYLTGTPGRVFKQYSSNGSVTSTQVNAKNGATVQTTIDLNLQQSAENVVKEYGEKYDADQAVAIIMNPNTGEILSMANYPNFNPNDPSNIDDVSSSSLKLAMSTMSEKQKMDAFNGMWTNFAVSMPFEPGSIFKPITVAAALENEVINKNETFDCPGYKIVNGTRIGCWFESGHGVQTISQALANSCDVALMDIADKLGRTDFYNAYTQFGYGSKTGIDLPAEATGIIFNESQLNPVELATSSFGQRFTCSALQALNAFSTTINGGNLMKPYVVSQIVDDSGKVLLQNGPSIVKKPISTDTSDYLKDSLKLVLQKGYTGYAARIPGYDIGGKTGTADQGIVGTANHSVDVSFIAYLPADNPQYIVMALINMPKGSPLGTTVTPKYMLKELVQDVIKAEKLSPTIPVTSDNKGVVSTTTDNGIITLGDYTGKTLLEATKELNDAGINYEFIGGSGTIVESQFPNAGENFSKNGTILLTIKNDPSQNYTMSTVPNLKGISLDNAKLILQPLGLTPYVVKQADKVDQANSANSSISAQPAAAQTDTPAPTATEVVPDSSYFINRQTPEAGTIVMTGTQVRLDVDVKKN